MKCFLLPDLVLSNAIWSDQGQCDPALRDLMRSDPMRPDPGLSDLMRSDLMRLDPGLSEDFGTIIPKSKIWSWNHEPEVRNPASQARRPQSKIISSFIWNRMFVTK